MSYAHAHVIVTGFVQGVFFRVETREEADRLGVKGWVSNRWDGTVEAVLEGDKTQVDKLINWLYKGPPHASVTNVEVSWGEYTAEFEGFGIR